MKLNVKLLITYAVVGTVLVVAIGFHAGSVVTERISKTIEQSYIAQLYQVDFALTNFLREVENDVLARYASGISVGEGSYVVLVDDQGIVLASEDEAALSKRYDEAGLNYLQEAMDHAEGYTSFEQDGVAYYLFYYTSPELGWKIGAMVPAQGIDRQASHFANTVVFWLSALLVLLIVLSAVAVRWFIVWPIHELQRSAETIMQTGDLDLRIAVKGKDELGRLAVSINEMIASIQQAEGELRASEEKYRSLVEDLNVGIFRSTPDGLLLHANMAAARILGYDSASEAAGFPVVDLYADPRDRAQLLQDMQDSGPVTEHEVRLVRRDGSILWVAVSLSARFDEEGRIRWLDGIIEDISARKEAEEALSQARDELEQRVEARTAELVQTNAILQQYTAELEARNAELDAFAHTVAHDLKNPLGNLVAYAEAFEQYHRDMPDDAVADYLRIIAQSGRKMIDIVNDLLLLASVREVDEIETQPLDMGTILVEAQERLRGRIQELGASIIVPDHWPAAVGYPPWVEEVWANYLSNALEYGGRPPHIELGYSSLDSVSAERRIPAAVRHSQVQNRMSEVGWVRFWVRDNGIGLSPEEQAGVFTPFERLHRAGGDGHGLGLSIVQRIVHKLGGEVGVESRGVPGQGCTFYFTLPADAGSPPGNDQDAAKDSHPEPRRGFAAGALRR
jgi:PAS domain S-box-containing protein